MANDLAPADPRGMFGAEQYEQQSGVGGFALREMICLKADGRRRVPADAAHAALAKLYAADGPRILAPRLRHDVGGLEALREQHGERASAVKSVHVCAMVDSATCAAEYTSGRSSNRSIPAPPVGSSAAVSIACQPMSMPAAESARAGRRVLIHRQCRTCNVVKHLTAFIGTSEGRLPSRWRDCAKARRRRAQRASF